MKRYIGIFALILAATTLAAQKPAYKLFNEDGKKVKYEKMLAAAAEADVVLFGEQHDDPIAHWLQYELTKDLFKLKTGDLILGAEMFESDNQLILDEYLGGLISEIKFEEEARLWPNYKTDYKPLVNFAKIHGLDFVASSIPRRYANSVYKQGITILDSLSEEALKFIAPLPFDYDTTLNCYATLRDDSNGHGGVNFSDSQALKDATMAHFILMNAGEGKLLLHFNGAYHSDEFESINYMLKRENPSLKIITISNVKQLDVKQLDEDNAGKADFILAVPKSMTKTRTL
jgi:uncharacterized iron-regulated protein